MPMSRKYRRSLAAELVTAIETVLSAGFEPGEFESAAAEVTCLVNEAEMPVPAATVVQAVEKALGLSLSEDEFAAALAAVAYEWRAQTAPAEIAPDAHLEMAFEDGVSGEVDV